METIFDYNPTSSELDEIGINSITLMLRHGIDIPKPVSKDAYIDAVSQDDAYFDLALLFELRGLQKQANKYWAKIPDRHQQYLFGFDDLTIFE
ncbi:MAG: hypothetical protein JST21_07710 [Bacteroidetes bacterium]|nr:hypothetical protein [Bacteroidota bacterium]